MGVGETQRPPRIVAVTGYGLGAGKTLSLTLLAYIAHKSGMKVWANYHMSFKAKYLWGPEQLEQALEDRTLTNCMIAFDDINTMIDSRRGTARINRVVTYFAQQARKRNLILAFSAPLLIWTDVRLDDLADWVIYSRFLEETEEVMWSLYDRRYFPPINVNLTFDARPVYPLFDTEEIILPESLKKPKAGKRRHEQHNR